MQRSSHNCTIQQSRAGPDVILSGTAEVAELADAPALGAGGRKAVGVRVPSSAPSLLGNIGIVRKSAVLLGVLHVRVDSHGHLWTLFWALLVQNPRDWYRH